MSEQLLSFIAHHRRPLEEALAAHLPLGPRRGVQRLNEALQYAVFPGGKRWRPMLTLLGATLVGATVEDAMPSACAIEYLHTSSLILDDLPAMDDANLRRGRAALHLVYGEGVALLAALALLNKSYELLALAAERGCAPSAAERLIAEAARCIGADGMIGGQAADLEARAASDHPDLLASRQLKTNGLLRLTMTAGAIAYGRGEDDLSALAHFGECLGTSYQIIDDLMDELGESAVTGKPVRQDARHQRPSYVADMGIADARRHALSLIDEGRRALMNRFADRFEAKLLAEAADFIIREAGRFAATKDVAAK
ncbi:MAG TPA: polyprenyl synthetase family protein [Blastocatellia bacterium]|nr:polyprenyl synthetase family protein [Blastocatellia bacterium]